MTSSQIDIAIVIGLATAGVILALGILDILTLALFIGVLVAGGFASMIATSRPLKTDPAVVEESVYLEMPQADVENHEN